MLCPYLSETEIHNKKCSAFWWHHIHKYSIFAEISRLLVYISPFFKFFSPLILKSKPFYSWLSGLQPSQHRRTRTRVRNCGTLVAFGRAGSDVSIASEGGFSALYGQVNIIRDTQEQSQDCPDNPEEYFEGIYIGGGKHTNSMRMSVSGIPYRLTVTVIYKSAVNCSLI